MNENIKEDNLYQQSKNRKKYLIALLLFLVLFRMGYAYLQTTLNISGTTKIDKNTWNVYWNNLQVTNGSVLTEEQGEVAATITPSKTTEVTFNVNLQKPGEYYEFSVDAKNDGTLDAMIDSIQKKVIIGGTEVEIPSYLDFIVTYDDGIELSKNQALKAGKSETYIVRVAYKKDITSTDMPKTDKNLTLSVEVNYAQADNTATEIRNVLYAINDRDHIFSIGESVLEGQDTYDNYQTAMSTFGYQMCIRHNMNNDVIEDSYIAFVYHNRIRYVKGGYADSYERNKEKLRSIFGENYCREAPDEDDPSIIAYSCTDEEETMGFSITNEGNTVLYMNAEGKNPGVCCISLEGDSACVLDLEE